ncbi:energy transducer TonB [Stenotrophomonas terrae]|uniref:energy transducer TonB n=1 Tax=Stenotrophomonas terrae TaxID=405446 RepID=UPI003D35D362
MDRESQPENPPRYSREWARVGIQDETILIIHVKPGGKVDSVLVEQSSGYQVLDESAETAARSWRYQPSVVNGEALNSGVCVPFKFRP